MANISLKDIRNILTSYNIKVFRYKRLTEGIENDNYKIITSEKNYVLRIYRNKTYQEIYSELQFIEFLGKHNVPLSEVIVTEDNKKIISSKKRYAVLFSFVEGYQPKSPVNLRLVKDIGYQLAKMHYASLKCHDLHLFRKEHVYNRIKNYSFEDLELQKIVDDLKLRLERFNKVRLSKAYIHGDIIKENLLVRNNKVSAFIDFDDFHEDYLMWDLAVALTHLFISSEKGIDYMRMKLFLKSYSEVNTINEDEKKSLILFMELRNLELAILMKKLLKEKTSTSTKIKSIQKAVIKKLKIIKRNEAILFNLIKEAF